MNTGEHDPTGPLPLLRGVPEVEVLLIQTKLHRWAKDDPGRRFGDLYNFIYAPDVLAEAWRRVKGNRGSRSAGVDGQTVRYIETGPGVDAFLADLRADLKARRFRPLPVKERMIPKPGSSKKRRLGVPTLRDRVVQAALKLVLEPIFEADFQPCSYGFRPKRRAQDAIAEIHLLNSGARNYGSVLEGDIEACFDNIDHPALMDRVRRRIGDKKVLALIKAFLRAGILTEDGHRKDTDTGTPQGGILSPLLANVALSVLDDHFAQAWNSTTHETRKTRRRNGLPICRLVRYADDFVVLIDGTRAHAEALRPVVADLLAQVGLRLSEEKTTVTHIDEGFDFLGWRIQRQTQRGSNKRYVYTFPSKKSLATIKANVKAITTGGTDQPLSVLLHRLNAVLRGWTTYFRHGVSSRTFSYLGSYTWTRVLKWLRRKHPHASWKQLQGRWLPNWRPTEGEVTLYYPATMAITRYRYRGKNIPSPWTQPQDTTP